LCAQGVTGTGCSRECNAKRHDNRQRGHLPPEFSFRNRTAISLLGRTGVWQKLRDQENNSTGTFKQWLEPRVKK
jgi:hypothetical protein